MRDKAVLLSISAAMAGCVITVVFDSFCAQGTSNGMPKISDTNLLVCIFDLSIMTREGVLY